jgi:hypothetical protein
LTSALLTVFFIAIFVAGRWHMFWRVSVADSTYRNDIFPNDWGEKIHDNKVRDIPQAS